MNILDWIIVVLLILGAFSGLRQGLVRSLMGLAGLVLGLILASQLYGPLCRYLEAHYSWVSRLGAGLAPHLPLAATVSSAPAGQGAALIDSIQGLDLPSFVKQYLSTAAQHTAGLPVGATIGQALATLMASAIIGVGCFFVIYFAVQIVAALIGGTISGAVSLTPLHIVDHVCGAAAGAATAAVFMTLVIGGLGLLASVPTFAFMQPALAGSQFASTFSWLFQHLVPKVPEWLGAI